MSPQTKKECGVVALGKGGEKKKSERGGSDPYAPRGSFLEKA